MWGLFHSSLQDYTLDWNKFQTVTRTLVAEFWLDLNFINSSGMWEFDSFLTLHATNKNLNSPPFLCAISCFQLSKNPWTSHFLHLYSIAWKKLEAKRKNKNMTFKKQILQNIIGKPVKFAHERCMKPSIYLTNIWLSFQ